MWNFSLKLVLTVVWIAVFPTNFANSSDNSSAPFQYLSGPAAEVAAKEFGSTLAEQIMKGGRGMQSTSSFYWDAFALKPPSFGVVAKDTNGKVIEAFDLGSDMTIDGEVIVVPGYSLPDGYSLERVGAKGWLAATGDLRSQAYQEAGFGISIDMAIDSVLAAGEQISLRFCQSNVRPTEWLMSFDASFKLVVGAGAGTQVRWDLDEVCSRENSLP